MEAGFDGPERDFDGVGDGLEVEAVDEAHEDDFLLDVAEALEEVGGFIAAGGGGGGIEGRVEGGMASGEAGAVEGDVFDDGVEEGFHLAAEVEGVAFAVEVGGGVLENVEGVLAVSGEPVGEGGDPAVVARVEGFEGGRVAIAYRARQLLIRS